MLDSRDYEFLPADPDEALLHLIELGMARVLEADGATYDAWVNLASAVNGCVAEMDTVQATLPTSPSQNEDVGEWITRLRSELEHLKARLAWRTKRGGAASRIEPVQLEEDRKNAIRDLTRKIRGVLNQIELTAAVRELLLKRLNAFESALDLTKTPYEAIIALFLDTTKAIGDGAENLKPVMDLVERAAGIMRAADDPTKLLAKSKETKALPKPVESEDPPF